MDFTLSDVQREWQSKARAFAQGELKPISLARDRIPGGPGPFDWDVVIKGSKLGFSTAALDRKWGGHGIDFVAPFVVDDTSCCGRRGLSPIADPITACSPSKTRAPGRRLRAERKGDEWILNGEKCFIANGSVRATVQERSENTDKNSGAFRLSCSSNSGGQYHVRLSAYAGTDRVSRHRTRLRHA